MSQHNCHATKKLHLIRKRLLKQRPRPVTIGMATGRGRTAVGIVTYGTSRQTVPTSVEYLQLWGKSDQLIPSVGT